MCVCSAMDSVRWPNKRVQDPQLWLLISIGCYVSSNDLVPGDVYEVTDPSLAQYPCDSILLTGDCIVNESMLTGKSILRFHLRKARV